MVCFAEPALHVDKVQRERRVLAVRRLPDMDHALLIEEAVHAEPGDHCGLNAAIASRNLRRSAEA